MANTDSARKRSRQAEKQRRHNSGLRSTLRSALKDVNKAISAGDKDVAKQALSRSSGIVDRIADKKIIHKNKAARHKSRLAAAIKAMP
jgi:small subunit ribosomal protein S20